MNNVLTIEVFLALIGGLIAVLTLLGVWIRFYFINRDKSTEQMARVAKENSTFRLDNEERFNAMERELTGKLTALELKFVEMEGKLNALLS